MKFLLFSNLRLIALILSGFGAAFAQPATPAEPPLRRLDDPAATETAPAEKKSEPTKKKRVRPGNREEMPFGDQTVAVGSWQREAVAISGSVEVLGEVQGDAVAVLGSVRVAPEAKVGQAAVAVIGRVDMQGDARDVVSVLGGVSEVNGPVRGEVVVVLGSLKLGPKAAVARDVTVIGGQLTRDPDAVVHGRVTHITLPGLGDFGWLSTWLRECALLGRPLAFQRGLGWAWAIAFGFLGFYLLLALLFSRGVAQCVATFERRPAMSVLAAVLTVLLSPVAIVILAITIVGGLLVPFIAAGLFFAGLFGKVVMLAWLGRRFTKFFGDGPLGGAVFSVLIGGLVLMLVYTIPFVGVTAYKLLSWLGLGVVMLTIVEAMKRNKRPPAAAQPVAVPAPPTPPSAPAPVAPVMASAAPLAASVAEVAPVEPASTPAPAGIVASFPAFAPSRAETPPPPPSAKPRAPVIDETTLPRANLLIRLAALALDVVLVGALTGFVSSSLPRALSIEQGPGGLLLALAIYGAVMWKTKGTTIGGIVCGLKVVRLDGREVDWITALVRALGCFLSMIVAGLGFIWVAFDDEQQSWHDKIAGTIVVRVPKGTSLV